MAAQDDAREKKMRDLFNLRVDPDRKRSDTDAYLDRPDLEPVPFELKSTTKTSISTVRDFNPDHVAKWRDKHWLFGFFDEQQELQNCCYASPAMMKPWIDKLEAGCSLVLGMRDGTTALPSSALMPVNLHPCDSPLPGNSSGSASWSGSTTSPHCGV